MDRPNWKDAMKTSTDEGVTPLRRMIKKMPGM